MLVLGGEEEGEVGLLNLVVDLWRFWLVIGDRQSIDVGLGGRRGGGDL